MKILHLGGDLVLNRTQMDQLKIKSASPLPCWKLAMMIHSTSSFTGTLISARTIENWSFGNHQRFLRCSIG